MQRYALILVLGIVHGRLARAVPFVQHLVQVRLAMVIGVPEHEMRRVVPALKESGGYIFSSDHSVPDSVSLRNFWAIVDLAKELGKYG